jgi:DNA invertase Pin-like site-specific DNA recombinase
MDRRAKKLLRCAVYTRKSTEHNLDLEFNSLDAQREACEAYIKSQAHEGWRLILDHYDDGAFSGASLDRPALQQLIAEVRAGNVDVIVVYKVDRLTRSLGDFAKLVELFDQHSVSFVSVTQYFNTTSSMGRLTLNVLLSFAQFEREVIGERVRDKIAASKAKGLWVGGSVPLGYASAIEHLSESDAAVVITLPWTTTATAAVKGVLHSPLPSPAMSVDERRVILTAIARARAWTADLIEGRATSFTEIAQREGKVERHIRLLAALAFVSPKIIADIADGIRPSIALTDLAKHLPYCWARQEVDSQRGWRNDRRPRNVTSGSCRSISQLVPEREDPTLV